MADYDNDGYLDIYVNNERIVNDNSFPDFRGDPSSAKIVIGSGDDDDGGDFDGVIDEVRMLDYQQHAFAGGLMLNSVSGDFPGPATVSIYNAADDPIVLTGIRLMKSGDTQCGSFGTGTLTAGKSTGDAGQPSSVTCTVTAAEGLYLVDLDGDNNDNACDIAPACSNTETSVIDGVCFNNGGGTDPACFSGQPMIDAGVWGAGTYVNNANDLGVRLVANGDNDEAVGDWEAIPEFSTLLMPIASVLLIVGYRYRRKNNSEA